MGKHIQMYIHVNNNNRNLNAIPVTQFQFLCTSLYNYFIEK